MTNLETKKTQIEIETGLALTTKKIKSGSLKGFVQFSPKRVNGLYPKFNFDYCQENRNGIDIYNQSNICIFIGNEVYN